jgi:hypothetical protein
VAIRIEGRAAEVVSPIFFGLPTEVAWTVSSVESMMARPCMPVIVTKFDGIHLKILRYSSEGQLASMPVNRVKCLW